MNWIVGAVAYLAGINAATFATFALDKRAAESGSWRVRERTLLALAAFGGTPGAIAGQRALRHKTRKQPFATYLVVIATVQVAAILVLIWIVTT